MGAEVMGGSNVSSWPLIDANGFRKIQLAQFRHDEAYHREISRLTVKARLTHMVLHFAKYAGYLAEAPNDEQFRRTLTDLFIIGISTVNSLNVNVHELLVAEGPVVDTSLSALTRSVTIFAGRMAAACEKLDHLESFPYRQAIQAGAVSVVALAISAAFDRGWSMEELVRERLQPVKEKSIFYGDL